jgi:sugar transferase (PEP-CTERM/EpsH1 system associated)
MGRSPLIAHVIHHLFIGGLENGLVNLINRIPPDRYRHCVICAEGFSDFRARIESPDVDVFAMHKSKLSGFGLHRRMHSLFRQLHPAIVHSRNLSGLDALLPAWAAGVPIRIHGEHGWDVTDLDGTRRKPRLLRRMHSPLVHRYVAVSKDLQAYLANNVGISQRRITQIYNGVDTQRFSPAHFKPEGIMPPSFYGDGIVVVGTVGRLQAVKNQMMLIRGFAQLLQRRPSLRATARLAVVGDGPMRNALADYEKQEGLSDVVWIAGARDDLPFVYRCFDVFVLPSLKEGISNTILEAMASGLPVVATAVGGNPELVDHTNGRLVPSSDLSALTDELGALVVDASLRARLGEASRSRAVSAFTLDAMVDAYLQLYDSMRAAHAPG